MLGAQVSSTASAPTEFLTPCILAVPAPPQGAYFLSDHLIAKCNGLLLVFNSLRSLEFLPWLTIAWLKLDFNFPWILIALGFDLIS